MLKFYGIHCSLAWSSEKVKYSELKLTNVIVILPNFIQQKMYILNQACASHRPAHAWFLEIALALMLACVCASVCPVSMCPPLRALITSGVVWHDIDHV